MANQKSSTVDLINNIFFILMLLDVSTFSGSANDWSELIIHAIRWSRKARYYLAEEVLFKHSNRFQEYLIDCTSAEVNFRCVFFSVLRFVSAVLCAVSASIIP